MNRQVDPQMTREFTEKRVRDLFNVIAQTTSDTEAIANCEPEMLEWTGLRRGAVVTFETVLVTLVTEMKPNWRHGFTGQLQERTVSRTETVTEMKTCKLRSKQGELYWQEVR